MFSYACKFYDHLRRVGRDPPHILLPNVPYFHNCDYCITHKWTLLQMTCEQKEECQWFRHAETSAKMLVKQHGF